MTRNEEKQRIELYKANRVISLLGYEPSFDMCIESPDIVLPSKNDKRIGIEVTDYIQSNKAIIEDAIYKVLKQYAIRLDKKIDKRYQIYVTFKFEDLPTDIQFNSIKENLFEEIDHFIFPTPCEKKLKYIESVMLYEVPGITHSDVLLGPTAFEYGETNESLLFKCITEKEKKLVEYKASSDNLTINEYYLVIYASMLEHPEVREYDLPTNFNTNYDRIYFVDNFEVKRLK